MAQPHNRGHASFTYNINAVVEVDRSSLSVTITHDARVQPDTFTLRTCRPRTAVAGQVFDAVVDSIAIVGRGGLWESSVTLAKGVRYAGHLVDSLVSLGVDDLADGAVRLPVLRDAVNNFNSSQKRTLNTLLARALRLAPHPDMRLPAALLNTKHIADDHAAAEPYTDAEVKVLRGVAREVLKGALEAQREVVATLGHDTSDRGWWNLGAADLIAEAAARDADRPQPLKGSAVPPGTSARDIDRIDWCLLNPDRFDSGPASRRTFGASITAVADALYPTGAVLVAGTILHCIVDNTGFNFSTLLRTEPGDRTRTGISTGQLATAKARNHTTSHHAVRFASAFSSTGGLVDLMTMLTRFNRQARAQLRLPDGSPHPMADKIYALHRSDPAKCELLTTNQVHQAYRSKQLQDLLDRSATREGIPVPSLRYQALRNYALYAGVRLDPSHDVVDHSARTRVGYLERCVPASVLGAVAAEANDEAHDVALATFLRSEPGRALGGAMAEGRVVDLFTTLCTSGGSSPDDPDDPCSLGLTACFTCPNGYRTADTVPGIVALADFTGDIRDTDPEEWANRAAVLHHYATESLTKFPATLVQRARGDTANQARHLAITAHLYTEFRR